MNPLKPDLKEYQGPDWVVNSLDGTPGGYRLLQVLESKS